MVSGAGLVLAVVLIIFGVYFNDRYAFAQDNVRTQLSEQKIFFPEKSQMAPDELKQPGVVKYAGQAVDNGDKAQVYANEYIGLHLKHIADGTPYAGKTYAELGGPQFAIQDKLTTAQTAGSADVANLQKQLDQIKGIRNTLFTGETLRGLLLTTYGFWTFGQEAHLAMVASFAGAGVLFLLVGLGMFHAVRSGRRGTDASPASAPAVEKIPELV